MPLFLFQLFKIVQLHRSQKHKYCEIIEIFPSLKYPPLESCKDYKQSLSYKYHLAYLLGEALIQTNRTWYKGGVFKLNQAIKKAKDKYQAISYITKKLKAFNQKSYEQIEMIELANSSQEIYSLLQTYKDYPPLLQVLFLNFSFFMQNLNEILSWLNSKEFKEQYLETNHPYPPLLNPRRLNARIESKSQLKDFIASTLEGKIIDCRENQRFSRKDAVEDIESQDIQPYPNLSYETISSELAWDLNLPLPKYYKFVYWGSHGCGNTGLQTFLRYCGIFECYYEPNIEVKKVYKEYFNKIIQKHKERNFAYLAIRNLSQYPNGDKFYTLIPKTSSLNLVRDPISSLKHYMIMKRLGKAKREITLHSDINEVCKNLVRYDGGFGVTPDIERIKMWINFRYMCFHDTQLKNALINLKDSIIIDMQEIVGEKTFDAILKLSKELGFPTPKEKDREKFKENLAKYGALLPLTLVVESQKRKLNLYILDKAHKIDDSIYLTGIAATIIREIEHCLDITQDLFHQSHFYDGIIVCIASNDWEILKRDSKTLQEVKDYLLKFIPRLQEQKEIEDKKKITESQVLEYFKEHKDLRVKFKQVLDEHLAYIKSVRPDIMESWKYYQEFERMCEELDKN